MRLWQAMLRFFDAHPWLLPSIAAVVTLVAATYKTASWARRQALTWRHRRDERQLLAFLSKQLNPGPFGPDSYGHTPRRQKDCSSIEIAQALRREPFKIRATLEQLEQQHR